MRSQTPVLRVSIRRWKPFAENSARHLRARKLRWLLWSSPPFPAHRFHAWMRESAAALRPFRPVFCDNETVSSSNLNATAREQRYEGDRNASRRELSPVLLPPGVEFQALRQACASTSSFVQAGLTLPESRQAVARPG